MSRTATQSLTEALAALVGEHDRTGTLVQVLGDSTAAAGATASAILVSGPGDDLEMLAATSHASSQLEVYQAQQQEGPCVDAIRNRAQTSATDPGQIRARWPGAVAERILATGFQSVHASPMRWYGQTIGALNTFYDKPHLFGQDTLELAQAFADVASLVIMAPQDVPAGEVRERVRQALRSTIVLERAKGVLVHQLGVDLATAYAMLVGQVSAERSVSQVADDIVTSAERSGDLPRA